MTEEYHRSMVFSIHRFIMRLPYTIAFFSMLIDDFRKERIIEKKAVAQATALSLPFKQLLKMLYIELPQGI